MFDVLIIVCVKKFCVEKKIYRDCIMKDVLSHHA